MQGDWIKVSRRMLDWEWYGDIYAVRVFLHLLLTCHSRAWRDRGKEYPAGSLVTSSHILAEELALDARTVRRVLANLKDSGEVDYDMTKSRFGTLLVIRNWRKYQTSSSVSNVPDDVPDDVPQAVAKCTTTPPNTPNKEYISIQEEREARAHAQQPPKQAPQAGESQPVQSQPNSLANVFQPVQPPRPRNAEEVLGAARLSGDATATIEDCKAFWDYYESQGWRKANGLPVVSWRGAFAEWMRRKQEQRKQKEYVNNDTVSANIRGGHYVSTDFSDYDGDL